MTFDPSYLERRIATLEHRLAGMQYATGEFTPAFTQGGTFTYSAQFGRWTLVGARCFVDFFLQTGSVASLTAVAVRVGSLPFKALVDASGLYRATVSIRHSGLILSSATDAIGRIVSGTNYVELYRVGDSISSTVLTCSVALAGGALIHGSGSYLITGTTAQAA